MPKSFKEAVSPRLPQAAAGERGLACVDDDGISIQRYAVESDSKLINCSDQLPGINGLQESGR